MPHEPPISRPTQQQEATQQEATERRRRKRRRRNRSASRAGRFARPPRRLRLRFRPRSHARPRSGRRRRNHPGHRRGGADPAALGSSLPLPSSSPGSTPPPAFIPTKLGSQPRRITTRSHGSPLIRASSAGAKSDLTITTIIRRATCNSAFSPTSCSSLAPRDAR